MTIYTIIMQDFIDAMLAETKPDWFDEVYAAYLSERMNRDSNYLFDLIKEISYLETKIKIINDSVFTLSELGHSDVIVSILKQKGITGRFDINTPEQYQADIKAAVTANKKNNTQLTLRRKDLDEYNIRNKSESVTIKDFIGLNIELSQFMGYRVDYSNIVVAEFCTMCNKYDAHIEVENAKANNLIRR